MTSRSTELLQGTLDLLILKAISLGPLHGYGVLLRLQQISNDNCRFRKALCTPPCIASSIRDSSHSSGVSPTTGGKPSSTR